MPGQGTAVYANRGNAKVALDYVEDASPAQFQNETIQDSVKSAHSMQSIQVGGNQSQQQSFNQPPAQEQVNNRGLQNIKI